LKHSAKIDGNLRDFSELVDILNERIRSLSLKYRLKFKLEAVLLSINLIK
jgi:hypothetical protein